MFAVQPGSGSQRCRHLLRQAARTGRTKRISAPVSNSASSSNQTPAADMQSKNNGPKAPKFIPPGYIAIAWEAADPNKDSLFYTIALKGAEDAVWKVLEEEVASLVYLLDMNTLADGGYYVQDHSQRSP